EANLVGPPVCVFGAIAPRHATGAADRKIYFPAGFIEFLGNLSPGLSATHHQDGAGLKFLRVAVGIGMNLPDVARKIGADGGDLGRLIEARRDHDVPGEDRVAILRGDKVVPPSVIPLDPGDAGAEPDRQAKAPYILLEVSNDLLPGHEAIGILV